MGLHLNYELRLPPSASVAAVENVLVGLRDFALALPFKSVTEIYRPEPGRCDSRRGGLRFLASVIAKAFVADIDLVRGFSVIPGTGSGTHPARLNTRRSSAMTTWWPAMAVS